MKTRVYTDMSPEAEKRRKASRDSQRRRRAGLPPLLLHNHTPPEPPIEKYILERLVRQEAGISTKPGFNIIGDGCFRARPHRSHT